MSGLQVVHVVKGLGLGGTEKVAQLLATHLDKELYSVSVLSRADGPRLAQLVRDGISVHISQDLFSSLKTLEPRIIHLHRAGWAEPALLRPVKSYKSHCLRLGLPEPVVVETNVFGRADASPEASVVDLTLFVSNFCLDRCLADHGPVAHRTAVMYNPVDTDLFGRLCPERDLSALVFGRLSRADQGKWSALALETLPLLAEQVPDFRFRLVGAIPGVEQYMERHGLIRQVDFLPPLHTDADLADFFNSISLLAHANDTGETFGLAIAEAMAAGLPVITHPCPYPRDNAQMELVEPGLTGLAVQTPEDYAQAVARLLTHPAEARQMGRAGREKAQKLFRAQNIAADLSDLYQDLLASQGKTRP